VLFVLGCAVYWPSLDNYFIADDLTELDFLRHYRGSWLVFLDPSKMFSDLVTHSRYRPVYVYYKWALSALFHEDVLGYHVLSLGLHALAGVAVLILAWRLFSDRLTAVTAAVLFVIWRLQSQMVVWIACNYRIVSVALVLWGIVALYGRRRTLGIACCVGSLVLAIGMNPELVVVPAILGCFAVYYRVGRGAEPELGRRFAVATAGHVLVTIGFVIATRISSRIYPVKAVSGTPDLARMLRFLANLFVPFECPLGAKLAIVALIFVVVLYLRDARLLLLAAIVSGCALTWGFFRAYTLTPRYLYLASPFASILLGRFASRFSERASAWLRDERLPAFLRPGERRRWAVLALLVVPLVFANVRAIVTLDLVHFEYLALLGQRLSDVQREARQRGEPARVFIDPASHLAQGDMDFFHPEIEFVDSPQAATRIVETDVERYRRRLGPNMADDYWFMPWFNQ